MTTEEYCALITAWQRRQPKFVATVAATVDPFAQNQVVTAGIPQAFDLDTAVGAQLDVDGEWIGRTRQVPRAYLDTYFRLDDVARGLDVGVWRQPFDPDTITITEGDDFYRRLLKAKVANNVWDGLPESTQAILDGFFTDPATHAFVNSVGDAVVAPNYLALDTPGRGLDESVWRKVFFALDTTEAGLDGGRWSNPLEFPDVPETVPLASEVGIAGKIPTLDELAALAAAFITPKSAGSTLTQRITSVDGAPLFGLDASNELIAGLDVGAWGVAPEFLVAQAA